MQKLGLARVILENKDLKENLIKVLDSRDLFLQDFKNIKLEKDSFNAVLKIKDKITNEMAREEIKNKLSVSWLKNSINN